MMKKKKKTTEKERHLKSQARTTQIPVQRERPEDIRTPRWIKTEAALELDILACNLQAESLEGLSCNP